MTVLTQSISIYVPSTRGPARIDSRPYVAKIAKELSKLFGGATAIPASGAWVNANGELITEKVTIVKSFASPEDISRKRAEVFALAKDLKADLLQDLVSIETPNGLELI